MPELPYMRVGAARQVLEVVASCTVGVDRLHVDRVTRAGRDVLDRQSELNSPAPLVIRMTSGFGRAVVGDVVVMRSHRRLEQAPSLVDAHLSNEVRRTGAADGVGAVRAADHAARGRAGHVEVAGLIVGGHIFRRERRRDALTEVSSVGELVDASDRAAAADEAVDSCCRDSWSRARRTATRPYPW